MSTGRQDQIVTVTLIVKGSDPEEARKNAERELSHRLNSWYQRTPSGDAPPFPDGSLLWFNIDVKGA